jgi:hypothetical protein
MAASVLAHHVETAAARWTEDGSLPDDVEHHMDGRVALGRARMVWLYALLCRLETPLVADDAATVRRLWKLCHAQRRAGAGRPAWRLGGLNLLMAVAGKRFGQADPTPPVSPRLRHRHAEG